jgi:hypothetical protein
VGCGDWWDVGILADYNISTACTLTHFVKLFHALIGYMSLGAGPVGTPGKRANATILSTHWSLCQPLEGTPGFNCARQKRLYMTMANTG